MSTLNNRIFIFISTLLSLFFAASQSSSISGVSSASAARSNASKVGPGPGQGAPGNVDEAEDTMKNLRKTFAGIFGDM